jgi:hypothetical protein
MIIQPACVRYRRGLLARRMAKKGAELPFLGTALIRSKAVTIHDLLKPERRYRRLFHQLGIDVLARPLGRAGGDHQR